MTHPIAKKALELAYDLSQFARDHYHVKYKDQHFMLERLSSSFIVLDLARQNKGL